MLKPLIKQAASVAGLRIIGTGLSVAVTIAIARLFGADALGIYAYCVALALIASVPISNGWSTMLLRSVSRAGELDSSSAAMARMGAYGTILITTAAALIGLAAIHWTSTQLSSVLSPIAPIIVGLIAAAMISDQLSAMRMAAIRGVNRPALAQLPESMIRPLFLLLTISSGWLLYGAGGLTHDLPLVFTAMAAAAVISAAVGQLILMRISPSVQARSVAPDEKKGWILSAGALAGSAGLVQLNGYADLLILGAFVAPAEIGHYRSALQIAMLASFGYVALNMLAGQRFSRFRELNDDAGMTQTATYLSRLALLSAIPLPVALLVFGEEIFALLFGADFVGAAWPALIIASGFTFSAAIGMARTLLVMHGKEFLVLRTTFAALALNITLCFVLIPQFGIAGAAIANCSAMIGWNALLWILARKQTGYDTSVFGLALAKAAH